MIPDGTLVGDCFEQLQDKIVQGIFKPGKKLKIEELKDLLKVGGSPIREALSRLVATGLVEPRDNKGFYVAHISEADIRDVYWTMFQIDMLALQRAMELGDDAWEAGIVAALHQLGLLEKSKPPVEYADWVERNYAFHMALIAGCKSPLLLQIRAEVYNRFDRYCRISFSLASADATFRSLELNHQEHHDIAQAVIARDAKRVYDLVHYHTFGSLEDVIKQLKEKEWL